MTLMNDISKLVDELLLERASATKEACQAELQDALQANVPWDDLIADVRGLAKHTDKLAKALWKISTLPATDASSITTAIEEAKKALLIADYA